MAKNLIKRALARRRQVRGRPTSEVELPDERLVLGVEFAIAVAICLSFLEVAHMALLGSWNCEIFATITGLTGIIIGLFVGKNIDSYHVEPSLMARDKPWTVEGERQLRQLLTEKKSMRSVAKVLGKTLIVVRLKASRLSLEVDDGSEKNTPSTSTFDKLVLPVELPSTEEELKTLVGALKGLEEPKLDKIDVLRLRTIIQGVKVYQELIADYIDYRGHESELMEWRDKYADLAKKSSNPPAK